MKKYFTIEESLFFLNEDIKPSEKLSLRDLFLFSAKDVIKPYFYFYGYSLWQETRRGFNYEKIYEGAIRGYFTENNLGLFLLNCLDGNVKNLEIRWAKQSEIITSYVPHEIEDIRLIGFDDYNSDALRQEYVSSGEHKGDCLHQIMDEMVDGKFLEYVYYQHEGVIVNFNDIYFLKSDLILLKNTTFRNSNESVDSQDSIINQLKKENEELKQQLKKDEDEYINLAIDVKATENTLNRIMAENGELKAELAEKEEKFNQLQEDQKSSEYICTLNELKQESEKDFKIKKQKEEIEQLILVNEQFSKDILYLKGKMSAITILNSNQNRIVGDVKEDYLDLTPEQEIPNSKRRNNILKIISILSEMAGLPPEPFTAFNMMEAHATQNSKEIPKKDTTADWLRKARNPN